MKNYSRERIFGSEVECPRCKKKVDLAKLIFDVVKEMDDQTVDVYIEELEASVGGLLLKKAGLIK